jgi:hemerythrin-like domain-containing protein
MSIRQFLTTGLEFCRQLEAHHSIEETYVFPMLARKMPEFEKQEHLLEQHKEIHKGLDLFQEYLEQCRGGERELRRDELKEIMDSFSKVLWAHLDDEVRTLGAENMRKHWSIQDMKSMPM